ncbi:MAG: serine/threonine protein kinase, partial [Lentisphaeria bacterium]|nr:serine/threonine protein kinase [Lentisphaeria bacterium]
MNNASENLPGATVEMAAVEFELPTDGNNNPEKQLDRENLELDTGSIDRLSVKPVQKYRFVRSIGRGGMKMVLQMKDLDATRDVAMAVLPEAPTRPREDLVRFIEEARITASLEHPNIVPVHEIGIDSTGAPYYTMKLLRGGTLAALIAKLAEGNEQFNAEYNTIRLLRIFLKICSGVAFAHSKGVIHLDLKPENIQVGDFGEVLIMDWGLAKVRDHLNTPETPDFNTETKVSGFGSGTLDGIMKGTPGYMAPEQAAGKNSARDERTDIYSLGAILYSLMTWKDPLEEKDVRDRIEA